MVQADTLNELDSFLVVKLPELEFCSVYYLIRDIYRSQFHSCLRRSIGNIHLEAPKYHYYEMNIVVVDR